MSKRFLLYWVPLIIWICAIFVVSSLPSNSIPSTLPESRISTEYPLHITAFFCLFVLFYRVLSTKEKGAPLTTILLSSLIFTMVVAFSKECWQILLPTRHFSLKDIFVDGGATILAMLVVGGSRWTREQPEHQKRQLKTSLSKLDNS